VRWLNCSGKHKRSSVISMSLLLISSQIYTLYLMKKKTKYEYDTADCIRAATMRQTAVAVAVDSEDAWRPRENYSSDVCIWLRPSESPPCWCVALTWSRCRYDREWTAAELADAGARSLHLRTLRTHIATCIIQYLPAGFATYSGKLPVLNLLGPKPTLSRQLQERLVAPIYVKLGTA